MIDTTKTDKKVIATKTKRKKKIKSQEPDTAERWLNEPENFLRPCVADNCTNPHDQHTLKTMFTKRLVRLSVLATDFCGVNWFDYNSLDLPCQNSVYEWYYSDVFSDKPELRTTPEIFSLIVKHSTYKEITSSAELLLDTMCRNRRYGLSDVSKNDIAEQQKHYETSKAILEFTEKQLRESTEENEIQSKGGRVE
jgi:hypothetical protein